VVTGGMSIITRNSNNADEAGNGVAEVLLSPELFGRVSRKGAKKGA